MDRYSAPPTATTERLKRRQRLATRALFPAVIGCLLLVVYVGLTAQAAVMAYIGGESLWTKAQKTAARALVAYTHSGDQRDYLRYSESMVVPHMGRLGRIEALSPHGDIAEAREHFVHAGNHPSDALPMVLLIRYFGNVSYIRTAIHTWETGDARLGVLDSIARDLHWRHYRGGLAAAERQSIIERIDRLDAELTRLERHFTTTLSDGARWLRQVLLFVSIVIGAFLAWAGAAILLRLQGQAARASEQLQRHETAFRALVEHSPSVIARLNRDLRYLYVSPALEQLSGSPSSDFVGRTHRELGRDTALVDTWERGLTSVFETGRDSEIAFTFETVKGPRQFQVRLAPEFDESGQVETVLAVAHDVTDILAAQQELAVSEATFRSAFESAGVGMALTAPDGRWLRVNKELSRSLGYTETELLTMDFQSVTHPDDLAKNVELLQELLRGERDGYAMEKRFIARNGSIVWIWLSVGLVRAPDGTPLYMVAQMQDISERKRAEERLVESLRFNNVLLDSTTDCVKLLDLDGRLTYMNGPGLCLMEIASLGSIAGCDWTAFWKDEWNPLARSAVQTARGGGIGRFQGFCSTATGTPKWWDVTVTPVRGRDGEIVQLLSVSRDITDMKRAEESLREKEAQLRQSQKMEAVGQLAGGIAHDFNNLLTIIRANADFLLEELPRGSEPYEEASQISLASMRASDLTRQLLAYSRKQLLKPKCIDPSLSLSGVLPMIRRLIGEDVEVRTTVDASGLVLADPGQLEQVLVNLAVNARDAMPEGGVLSVGFSRASRDDAIAAGASGAGSDSYVLITISDTGIGMDSATRDRAFEPFFTTKPLGKGTGLGLSTVYGIIAQSGGHVTLDSVRGVGTTFRIFLPEVEQVMDVVPTEDIATARGEETLLVVEDEPHVGRLVVRSLERLGYSVHLASDAMGAFEVMRTKGEQVSLILSDVVMPDISGPELVAQLRLQHPGLRALYMTGYTNDEVVRRGLRDTSIDVIQKPFTPGVLADAVRRALDAVAA